MQTFQADLAVIGAGGAGLRAAIAAAQANPNAKIALISKVYPMRSHTVAAEGGSAAVAQDHAGQIPLPRRRLSDEIPVAHRFTGAQQKPVEPRTGEAEIRHLVALELHVDVLELSHERRMVGKRLIC